MSHFENLSEKICLLEILEIAVYKIVALNNLAKFKWQKTLFSRLQNFWCFAELTVSQYLRYGAFPLRCSFQPIFHWWTPNQRIKVDDATQLITEVYLDVQTAVRGNFWIWSVWLTSLKRCIRACYCYLFKHATS